MQNSADGILITDEKNQIIKVNQSFLNMYGYTKEELMGKNPNILSSHKLDEKFYKNMWNDLNTKAKWSGEIINKKKDGTLVPLWISITALHDENYSADKYLAMFTDLTQLKDAQKKMEFMVYHDSLTNLYNKSYLEIVLNTEYEKSLILLNINNR